MSLTTATDAFRAAIRRGEADVRMLVRIDLATPSALTLRYGTTDLETPDHSHWQAGLEADPLTDACGWLDSSASVVTWQFALPNVEVLGIAPPVNLSLLLSRYQARNARVRAYLWEMSCTVWDDTPGAGDNLQIYDGTILNSFGEAKKRTFSCSQPTAWNVMVPPTMVDKVTSPNAPDAALGLPYPIIVGSWKKPTPISPFGSGDDKDHDQSGGGRLAVPLIITDPGQGAADVHATAACHSVKKIVGFTDGHSVFAEGDGRLLAPLDSAGVAEVLGASESYVTIDDGKMVAYAAILPAQVATAAPATVFNTADNPRAAMNPFDLSSYAVIDQNATKNYLRLWLPRATQLGDIIGVEGIMAFVPTTNVPNPRKLVMSVVNLISGATAAQVSSATPLTAGTKYIVRATWSPTYYDSTWDFTLQSPGVQNYGIQINFDGGTTYAARVYWCGLIVKYRPSRTLIQPSKTTTVRRSDYRVGTPAWKQTAIGIGGYLVSSTTPEIAEFSSSIWANVEGADDDGSGTYTGSAGALIERPADVVRWLLCHFGGLNATSDFEVGAGQHGSFVDARDAMRDAWPEEFKVAAYVGQQQKLSDVVRALLEQSFATAWLDRFTGIWRFLPWKAGATPNYGHTFSWDEIDLTRAETTNVIDAAQEIRLRYGFDARTGTELWESFLSPSGSSMGYAQPTWRDQQTVTITAANKYVDFNYIINFSGTLALGTYSRPILLAKAVADAMCTAYGSARTFACGYGFSVLTGYNDTLEFNVGGGRITATMNGGDYTPEGLATEVARALNATGSGVTFSCTYSVSSNTFAITGSGTWNIDTSVALTISPAWLTLGYFSKPAGTTKTANFARYNEHYWINSTQASAVFAPDLTVLDWASGAHTGSNCAAELGWDVSDVAAGVAPHARGMREPTAAALLALNGARDPDSVTLDMVNDEATAARIRNRRFDLRGTERTIVTFGTLWAPDLQRLRVIDFDSTLDAHKAFPRYGSDGSWAGKSFLVLSVTQYPDSQMHQEITAIEV